MSTKKRTYKFNWLDHLYYMGVNYGPARWPMPFEALAGTILMWPFVFFLIALRDNQTFFFITLCVFVIKRNYGVTTFSRDITRYVCVKDLSRSFYLTLQYTFNSSRDRYKGRGAGANEKNRF